VIEEKKLAMIEPHGGKLVDKVVGGEYASQLRSDVSNQPSIDLDTAGYQDLINISNGRYSPLEGFMTQSDFLKVVHDMTLEDGTVWPLPIVLDVSPTKADELKLHEKAGLRDSTGRLVKAGLRDSTGRLVGAINIEDVYKYNNSDVATSVFGADDTDHPGVQDFHDRENFLIGGEIYVFSEERYNEADLFPKETRVLFEHHDWETVVGFQTRNAPHRAHEYIQKSGAELVDGILIQPKLGEKKEGDYRDEVILGAYRLLLEHYYPDDRATLSVFPSKMNYAGPREAVFDALVRKNQGCTHFIIG
jgi:sulfate adenylyltransferase